MSTLDKDSISNLIRSYVHYDNLASQFNKQTQNARAVRDDFENRIIETLKKNNMENAIIQIVGGKLKVAEEKHYTPLTYNNLEESLHKYYTSKKKVDETNEILKFIKTNRTFETSKKLKKVLQLPPQPSSQILDSSDN